METQGWLVVIMISPEMLPTITSFLFVFAVVYAVLVKASLLPVKGSNIIIAIVVALFASLYSPLVDVFQTFLPIAALLLVFVFFVLLFKSVIGGKEAKDSAPMVAVLVIALMLLAVLWNDLAGFLPAPFTPDIMLWLLGIFIIIMIFYAAYTHSDKTVGDTQ